MTTLGSKLKPRWTIESLASGLEHVYETGHKSEQKLMEIILAFGKFDP